MPSASFPLASNLRNSVKQDETLRFETVRQIWQEVKSNSEYEEEREDANGKTKSGCCSSGNKKDTKKLEKREERELVAKVDDIVSGSSSSGRSEKERIRELVNNFEPVFNAKKKIYNLLNAHFAELLNKTGLVYFCLEDYATSKNFLERGLKLRRELDKEGQTSLETAESYTNVGMALFNSGEMEGAHKYFESGLNIRTRAFEAQPDNWLVAESLNNMGMVYFAQAKYEKALESFERALSMRQSIYGKDAQHVDLAESLNNVGMAYFVS